MRIEYLAHSTQKRAFTSNKTCQEIFFFIRAFFVGEACLLDNLETICVEDNTVHTGLQPHHHLHKLKQLLHFFPSVFVLKGQRHKFFSLFLLPVFFYTNSFNPTSVNRRLKLLGSSQNLAHCYTPLYPGKDIRHNDITTYDIFFPLQERSSTSICLVLEAMITVR
jgi:hypothetical protein